MKSAFGVEHVSKSFVNGKFVKAVDLSAKQAGKVRAGGQWKKARGATKHDRKFREHQTAAIQGVRDMKEGEQVGSLFRSAKHAGKDSRGNVKLDVQDHTPRISFGSKGGEVAASAAKIGPKRGGVNIMTVHGSGDPHPAFLAHEKAHLAPNRGGYRMAQIMRKPGKAMREEARADATADKKLKRASPFKMHINDVSASPGRSGYEQAARGRDLSRSSEHVGSTLAGRAAKKVPGLRNLVRSADDSVRGQYKAQIVRPGLKNLNSNMRTKKPVKGKHLDEYKRVYENVRGKGN